MKNASKYLLWVLLLLGTTRVAAQEPASDAATKEAHYNALKGQCEALESRLDSLQEATSEVRIRFREEPEARELHTATILKLEEQMLQVGNEHRQLVRELALLEQERMLQELNKEPQPEPAPQAEVERPNYEEAPRHRYLIRNACFRGELPAEEYQRLCDVQEQEREAARMIELFAENYARLVEMQQPYLLTTKQHEADSLYEAMCALIEENNLLNDSLHGLWEPIFDHKSYAYAYLLDRFDCEELLEGQIERLSEARREADATKGEYASDALSRYFIEKRALTSCELELAAAFHLQQARDSLQQEADYLSTVDYRLPRLSPERRYLLDYASVEFPGKVSYTTYKVPACEIPEQGSIYRIRLLSSRYRQQADIFRGVEPLYLLQEGGRYLYFTGGFASLAEARLACELLREKGFRLPVVVRWTDGRMEEVSEQESESLLRIEISGSEQLPEGVRALIREALPGHEISRVGSSFRIGGLTDPAAAEELARRIRLEEGSLEVSIVHEN